MLDGERPEPHAARVVPVGRGGRQRRRRPRDRPRPETVTERLQALEREVEGSLASDERGTAVGDSVWLTLDGMLERYADLLRWLSGESLVPSGRPLGALPLLALYRYWWRVQTVGLERVPAEGPVLLVANRAGTLLPYDAFMVAVALATDHPTGRRTRPLVDEWLTRLPLVGSVLASLGAEPATPARLRAVIDAGDAAIVFPEGRESYAKPFDRRYRLGRFGRTALIRTAIEAEIPIVPVAVIGAEETHPVLWRSERVGRSLGLPALPITPTLVPLPTKWTLHVGPPLESATLAATTSDTTTAVKLARTQLRERLQGLVSEGLGRRKGLFFSATS